MASYKKKVRAKRVAAIEPTAVLHGRKESMASIPIESPEDALAQPVLAEAVRRGIVTIADSRIKYILVREQSYNWDDPEEWVRAFTVAWLIVEKGYPANRIKLEVTVPRRTPADHADIVVYADDRMREPYLVIENKSSGQTERDRNQAIEQAFGNANSLRSPLALTTKAKPVSSTTSRNIPPANGKRTGSVPAPRCRKNTATFRSIRTSRDNPEISSRYHPNSSKPGYGAHTR